MKKFNLKLWDFITSRFYKWSKIVVWIAAILIIANAPFTLFVITAVTVIGYTVLPQLIARILDGYFLFRSNHPTRNEFEKYIETSPMIKYLRTLCEDVQQFNTIKSDWGVQFYLAVISLVDGGTHIDSETSQLYETSLTLRTTPDEDRNMAIRSYKNIIASWYPGSCPKSKEELEADFSEYFHYDKDGYIAKNKSFCSKLRNVSVDDFEPWGEDPVCYDLKLPSFYDVSKYCNIVVASKAIKECFPGTYCRRVNSYYYHIVIKIPCS